MGKTLMRRYSVWDIGTTNWHIMTMDTDRILDRRRLKRSLTFWRVVGVLAIVAIGVITTARLDVLPSKPHVARLVVDGLIVDDLERNDVLADLVDDDAVRALVVNIDSPGGTFVGGENLYRGLRRVAENMPVVAIMGNTGTSAAYMTAIATERIFVREGTITGSIGVILQTADVTGLLEKLGVKPETVKSDPLKAQPSPVEPFSPAARQMIEGVIADLHDIFVGMVSERRDMAPEEARRLADGRIFTGRQALDVGLIDAIGDERDALEWLVENANIDPDLPITDVTPRDEVDEWQDMFATMFGKVLFSERLRLDGILALWHPQLHL